MPALRSTSGVRAVAAEVPSDSPTAARITSRPMSYPLPPRPSRYPHPSRRVTRSGSFAYTIMPVPLTPATHRSASVAAATTFITSFSQFTLSTPHARETAAAKRGPSSFVKIPAVPM